jgi:hypothetical protein
VLATVHPSSILRVEDDSERETAMDGMVADLRKVSEILGER